LDAATAFDEWHRFLTEPGEALSELRAT